MKLYGQQTSTEGLNHYTYNEDKLKEIKHTKPLEPINFNKHKDKSIVETIEQIYDISQEPSIDEVQEQEQEQVQEQKQIIIACKE